MLRRIFVLGAGLASLGAAIGYLTVRTAFRRWGIDPAEGTKALPGDELVPDAELSDTRGIDLEAAPESVWPWLVQMGYGRAGWYSYDQLDMNKPSADRIIPELQHLAVGDVVPTHPGGGFEVRILEPGSALVLYADRELIDAQREVRPDALDRASANVKATGAFLDASMQSEFRASWAFVLEPRTDGGTRLIERFRGHMELPTSASGMGMAGPKLAGNMLEFGLFVMVRRQMLGIRDRVEGRPVSMARAGRWSPLPRMGGAAPA